MDQRLVDEFRRAVGPEAVLTEPVQLVTYECDALPHLRSVPELVLLPRSAADVQAIVRICNKEGVPFVAGDGKPECIVSGGAGTIAVTFQGQTYYVCCSGCRAEFNETPEKYIKEFQAKKNKK